MRDNYFGRIRNQSRNLMKEKTFTKTVYLLCSQIPKGKVATYAQLARLAGNPRAARAVGTCMRTNKNAPLIPCHRVVTTNGSLGGYSAGGGLPTKKKLLLQEGVLFVGDRVDLPRSQWEA